MNDRELENRLAQAVRHASPDDFGDVISRSDARKGSRTPMTRKPKNTRIAALGGAIAACLALMLAGGMYYRQTGTVASVISLDVNPSIELAINKNDKVLSCTPLNADAAVVLFDMGGGADLKGTNVAVAVNAIVGAMARCGYLDSISSAILLTVEDNDQQRASRLQTELSDIANTVLQAQASSANVISQALTVDAGLEKQARQNNISTGKAALINQAIALNSSLSFDALSALSVDELKDLIQTGAPGMPIGKSAASYAAEVYAGTAALNSVTTETDAELDEIPAHYEVELHTTFGEYDYMVDAYTGEILRGIANILAFAQGGTPDAPVQQPGGAAPTAPPQQTGAPAPTAPPQQAGAPAPTAPPQQAGAPAPTAPPQQVGAPAPTAPAQQASAPVPAAPPQQPVIPAQTAPQQTSIPAQAAGSYIGPDAAKSAALAHAGVKAEDTHYCNSWLEYEGRHPAYYEVEFLAGDTEYEYEIDLYSGAVLKFETERRDSSYRDASAGSSGSVSGTDIGPDAAKQAAFSHAGLSESQVSHLKVKRDYDDGRLEYEVEFKCSGMEYDYTIDAATGSILEYDCDRD